MLLNWPNRITLARILAVPLFVNLVLQMREGGIYRELALGVFLALGLADLVDGWLARRLGQQTRLGSIIDPLADKMLLTAAVILLAVPEVSNPTIPRWLVVLAVSRDAFLVVGQVVLYLLIGRLHIQVTRIGRMCTMSLMAMVTLTLAAGFLPPEMQTKWGRPVLLILAHAAAVLVVASGLGYALIGRAQLGAAAGEPAE